MDECFTRLSSLRCYPLSITILLNAKVSLGSISRRFLFPSVSLPANVDTSSHTEYSKSTSVTLLEVRGIKSLVRGRQGVLVSSHRNSVQPVTSRKLET